jgi:GT2 family glycosyltransferase
MSRAGGNKLAAAVVIATCNRAEPLRDCLNSLGCQSLRPDLVIVVDSSDGDETADMIEHIQPTMGFPIRHERTISKSAARQRNLGAERTTAEVIVFLDDDVVLEEAFLSEVMSVFQSDLPGEIGGVSGTISNQIYTNPRGLNRFLLGFCLGRWTGSYAGQLLGPAINFLPADEPNTVQEVEWLPSGCSAYRREVFMSYRFGNDFGGYSFAEDVHLSSRVRQTHRLLNTTRARVFHHDLGKSTHKDWKALGESQVVNRHAIMVTILGRNRLSDHIQLFGYEVVYTSLSWLAAGVTSARLAILVKQLRGKLSGFSKIWSRSLPRSAEKGRADVPETK